MTDRQHCPALVWVNRAQKNPSWVAMMAAKPVQARDGKRLRSGLHRVMPQHLIYEEIEQFEKFMFEHYNFAGDFAIVTSGKNFGQFAFVEKKDAVWFQLFWSLCS